MFEKKNLIEILSSKKKLENKKKIKIKIISNIILNNLSEILEYYLSEIGFFSEITVGDYDNIIQETQKTENYDLIIIYYEVCNFVDGFDTYLFTKDKSYLEKIIKKVKKDLDFISNNIPKDKMIFFNKFTYRGFVNHLNNYKDLNCIVDELNKYIQDLNNKNLILIDIENIFAEIGLDKCIDTRLFYSSKVLYKATFFIEYSKLIISILINKLGLGKKVLILDCDNTLWKGIVGDDGPEGIEMSKNTELGLYFYKVQKILKSYKEKGILICLCSKNNPENVDEILENHPDMQLKNNDIIIKKVNWEEKYKNITEISNELNIYPDNFIFLDDSDFEINAVKHFLPQVMCVQVPKDISEYPKIILQLSAVLEIKSFTSEDKKKYQLYKEETKRYTLKKSSNSIENYLKSLNINLKVNLNNQEHITRIAQLSSKTNQFNMNKNILDEEDIKKMISDKNHYFFTGEVYDDFGNMGITNLAILEINKEKDVIIKNMIMSCRVFGRMIEYSFLNYILNFLKEEKFFKLSSFFKRNEKNKQFDNFYIENGFKVDYVNNDLTKFIGNISEISVSKNIDHIKINIE